MFFFVEDIEWTLAQVAIIFPFYFHSYL